MRRVQGTGAGRSLESAAHAHGGEKERGETLMRYSGLVLGGWLKGQQHDTHVLA